MAEAAPITSLPYAVGIELPGGAMRTFLEAGTMFPTPHERVRLVSRLRERTRLQLRVLAKPVDGPSVCLGSAHLQGIRLNPQGEAQLLVSLQCNNPEFVELQLQDELGKQAIDVAFRLPLAVSAESEAGATLIAATQGPATPADTIAQLLQRVTVLEQELELKYLHEDRAAANGAREAGSGAEASATDDPAD